jgi:hypothetical protein
VLVGNSDYKATSVEIAISSLTELGNSLIFLKNILYVKHEYFKLRLSCAKLRKRAS